MSDIYFPNKPVGGGGDTYVDPIPNYHIGTGKDYATFALARAAAIANSETNAIAVIHEDLDESIDVPVNIFSAITTSRDVLGSPIFGVNKVILSGDSDREFVLAIQVYGVNGEDVIQQTGKSNVTLQNCIAGLVLVDGVPDATKTPARIFFQTYKESNVRFENGKFFKFNNLAGGILGAIEHRGKTYFTEDSYIFVPSSQVAQYSDAPYSISNIAGAGSFEVDNVITGQTSGKTAKIKFIGDDYLVLYDVEDGFIDGEPIENADGDATANLSTGVTIINEYRNSKIQGRIRGSNTAEYHFENNTSVEANRPVMIVNGESTIVVDNSRIDGTGEAFTIEGTGTLILKNPDFGEGGLSTLDEVNLTIENQTGNILSGATQKQVIITSNEIAAGGNQQINKVIAGNNVTLLHTSLVRTGGSSSDVSVEIFSKDDFTTGGGYIYGYEFGGVDASNAKIGPRFNVPGGASALVAPQNYIDEDYSNELHVRINNKDGANPGTFELKITYLVIPE